jgi:hypothetical protein
VAVTLEFDRLIEKFAAAGEKRWAGVALLSTGKGVRRIPIEYLPPGDLPKAREWLAA